MAEEILLIDDGDRYGRLRLISWWRQDRLREAKVLVVGAGALGNEVLKNLALLGIGHVFIVDCDTIETSNLTRSILYRAADAGRPKSERAAEAVKAINPEVRVAALHGNVITDLGLGVFAEMDVVIACLDSREARLWVNRQCWKVGRPWVDGAIQEISGVAKVFVPPGGACYECAMTERDYQLLNLKYSCPLLKNEDLAEGKVPTVPTISSIIAGIQTQEALKILHGMPVQEGAAMVFNGESNRFYVTRFQRRQDCLSHETWGPPVDVPLRASDPVEGLLRELGGRELHLERDLLTDLSCPRCGTGREVFRPLASVTLREGRCGGCGGIMRPGIMHTVASGSGLARRTLREVGVAPYDIVRISAGDSGMYVRLAGDRAGVMAWR